MDRWRGKIAVVTGASAGIGAAIAVALANEGLRVVGLARRPHLVDELSSQVTGTGSIVSRGCDVSKPEEISASFSWVEKQFGGIDLLVNNAALHFSGSITDAGGDALQDSQVEALLDVNVRGVILGTRHAVASMRRRRVDGHIININSLAGHYVPFSSTFNIYSSTKHAITAFSTALANEFADHKVNIKITSVSPGLVRTDMTEAVVSVMDLPLLQPSDVAEAVRYVVSTPPGVNISELTIQPVAEKRL